MTSPVIDLSHHNPTPDWAKLKSGGVTAVIHKATESDNYLDPTLFDRARAAMAAGLCWATYHFLRPGSMKDQMAYYLDAIDPVEGERVCLDHEVDGVSLDDLVEAVKLLLADPRKLKVAIYSGHIIKEQLGNGYNEILAKHTDLWIAQYAASPSWPTGTWPQWSLWQWTDKESVPGISAPVDGDRWSGTSEELLAWFNAGQPVPQPKPEQQPTRIAISTGDGPVVITVNGDVVVST